MRKIFIFTTWLLLSTNLYPFFATTLIQTPNGPLAIKDLRAGDMVWSDGFERVLHESTIISIKQEMAPQLIHFLIGDELIHLAPYQSLFVENKEWVQAQYIQHNDKVITLMGNSYKIKKVFIDPNPKPVYKFSLKESNIFFVGEYGFLALSSPSSYKSNQPISNIPTTVAPEE